MTDGVIQLVDGEILLVDGEVGTAEDCCCQAETDCNDISCSIGWPVAVTASGVASCASDSYNMFGGWCGTAAGFASDTDFGLTVVCQGDGTYLIQITSTVGGLLAFSGTATTAELTCDGGGNYSGTIVLAGQDMTGGGGPDWSGETATCVF